MRLKVCTISYLNTIPFVHGLRCSSLYNDIDMIACTPAVGANMLSSGEAQIGIIPVAALGSIDNCLIIGDYCIGATGPVASVLLCSGKPLSQIENLFLDNESRTSVALAKILCEKYWNINPTFTDYNYSSQEVNTHNSYILIGDKAMKNSHKFEYVYDLAQEWIEYRRLPFVFASWVSNTSLSKDFCNEFNAALKYGVNNIEEALMNSSYDFDFQTALRYLNTNISYIFDADKRAGLADFWSLAPEVLKSKVRWFG